MKTKEKQIRSNGLVKQIVFSGPWQIDKTY